MNTDIIFNIILYTKPKYIHNLFINKAAYQLATDVSLWQLLIPPLQYKENLALLPKHYNYTEYVDLYRIRKTVQFLIMNEKFRIKMDYGHHLNVKYLLPEKLILNDIAEYCEIKISKNKDYKIKYCSLTHQLQLCISKQETIDTLIKLLYYFNVPLNILILK